MTTKTWSPRNFGTAPTWASRVVRDTSDNRRTHGTGWAVAWQRYPLSEVESDGDNSAATDAAVWGALTQRSLKSWMDENPY